jgi:ribosome-binding factor A
MVRQPTKEPTQRQLRVGEEVRHALAMAIERGEIHDPALAGQVITVTEVRVSPDLKNATAFVIPLGGDGATDIAAALNKASGFLRTWVARNVRLRHVPRINFIVDLTFDEAAKIGGVLNDPRVRRDIESANAEDDAET